MRAADRENEVDVVYRDLAPLHDQAAHPKAFHPPDHGPLVRSWAGEIGGLECTVRSSARRKDGWSYNLAMAHGGAVWCAFTHHAPTGKRILQASSAGAEQLARVFQVD